MQEFIIYIIVGVLVFTAFFLALIVAVARLRKKKSIDQKFFQEQWQKILAQSENNPHQAILNADKLIDKSLELKGYRGTLGEKLKASDKLFSDINGLWSAHKLRNTIAHEIDHNVSKDQAKAALRAFKKALRDLDIQI